VAGNIRELQNFIERSVILTSSNVLHPPLASLKSAADVESLGAITLEDAERDHIRKTLEQTRWVVAGPNGAAARLGIKRSTLYFRIAKAWHLAYQARSPPHAAELRRREDRPPNRLTP